MMRFNGAKRNPGTKHERVVDWEKAKETEARGKGKCVVVPVTYATEYRPSFAVWDEETSFREKLLEYYINPIFEALVVYTDERGQVNAYLSQVAYDRYHIVNDRLDLDKFYGWFLKADWDDTVTEAAFYENGRQKRVGKNIGPKAKISTDCGYFATGVTLSYYYGQSCGVNCSEIVLVYQREYVWMCFEEGSGGGAGEAYPYEVSAPEEGGGGGPLYVPVTTTYNPKNAICNPNGGDRWQMNDNLSKALDALGLFSGVADFSNSMVEALVRSIGGSGQSAKTVQTILGRTVGYVTLFIDGREVIMGLTDGDISQSDMIDVLGLAAGGGALLATGWLAVGLTAVSVGIGIYNTYEEYYCD